MRRNKSSRRKVPYPQPPLAGHGCIGVLSGDGARAQAAAHLHCRWKTRHRQVQTDRWS